MRKSRKSETLTYPIQFKAEIKRFPPFSFVIHFLFVSLQLHLLEEAMMYIELYGANGRSTTYLKALLTLCFWTSKLPQSNTGQEQCRCDTTRGVVYTSRSVLRGLPMSSLAHFTGILYTPEWMFTLSVFLYGCGRPRSRTGRS
jgi:hypothetical protein